MKRLAVTLAAAVLAALPAAAQQSPTPAPGVPTSPHQTDVLRQHPSGANTTGNPATTPPTAGGGSAPGTPHQSQVLRGQAQQDNSSAPSGGRLPAEPPRR